MSDDGSAGEKGLVTDALKKLIESGEKYDEAIEFAKENINLNKEYSEGEYVFKNLLEELLFQITINNEIKKKYPLILDYSSLFSIIWGESSMS